MQRDSKIYVAGHDGMVGSALVRKLTTAGYTKIVVRSFAQLDLRRQHDVEQFFEQERPEYVFLAAAKVGGILANNTYKAEFIYDNLLIATNVIHSAYQYGVKKLLNLGSSCIYPKHAPQPLREEYLLTGLLEPTNEPYALAKIAAIKLCSSYQQQYGCNFISLMPTNLYGPHDNFDLNSAHVLPALMRKFHEAKIMRKNKVVIWGTGSPFREFLHVDDLADAALLLMESYHYRDLGECINVGTGQDITISNLAALIKTIIGFRGEIMYDTSKPNGTSKKLLDVSRLHALGWKHSIALVDGIKQTYDWYLEKESNVKIKENLHEDRCI